MEKETYDPGKGEHREVYQTGDKGEEGREKIRIIVAKKKR